MKQKVRADDDVRTGLIEYTKERKKQTATIGRHIQSREDWELRALKLLLAYPVEFNDVRRLMYSDFNRRNYCDGYFDTLKARGVLSHIQMGANTPYRRGLLIKTCRALYKEGTYGRKLTPEDQAQAQTA